MKRTICFAILVAFLSLSLCACGTGSAQTAVTEAETEIAEPDLAQIRSICELATLECYYHNVAKSTKEAGSGLLHIGEVERTFWIEYTGSAKIGIDMSEIQMSVDGLDINITLPPAKLLSCEVAEIYSEDYISSADGIINKNKITAEDQTSAVNQAQEDMESEVANNSTLLTTAQNRAQKLIANYIEQLGTASGVEFHVTWEYSN